MWKTERDPVKLAGRLVDRQKSSPIVPHSIRFRAEVEAEVEKAVQFAIDVSVSDCRQGGSRHLCLKLVNSL